MCQYVNLNLENNITGILIAAVYAEQIMTRWHEDIKEAVNEEENNTMNMQIDSSLRPRFVQIKLL